ncbi:Remodeling and spacing factor 1 [Fasciolopsis buskii]|uniref:Remodeling and spacing factor 1 n=1 Tax=Fasciolopsis buskii TaxID=27845 RepID=A0A8E0RUK3_9TREM|nr:Remodeling and spacing factor 1 [Fasciolopsis buski]
MHLIHFLSITFPRTPANWKNWETLHIKLLNKLKYRAKPEKWEPVLGRFIFNHAADIDGLPEAAECLVSGVCDRASQLQSTPIHIARPYSPVYYGLGVEVRTRLLLTLLESQFDRNQSFKDKVNLRSAVDLRFRPLGYDVWGRIYWLLKDSEINVLLYREDSEKKAFQLVCRSTEEMRTICTQLENACPASSKLSDILKSGADGVIGAEKAGSVSLSLDTTLQKLVQDGIASTETDSAMHLDPETALVNGKKCSNLDQSPDSDRSPHCVAQNGLKNLYQPNDVSPLREMKKEPYLEQSHGSAKSPEEMLQNSDSSLKTDLGSVKPKLESDKLADSATVVELNSVSCDKIDEDQDDTKVEVKSENRENPSEENLANHIVPAKMKSTKRGRRPKTACHQQVGGSVDESAPTVEVRRSGRVRKPVEFLTIEVPQPKRLRQAAKPTGPLENGLTDQPKKKRCSTMVVTPKKKRKKKRKHKRRHAKKSKSSNPWLNATSSSESDEDDTFERALREHEETIYDSDAADANRNKPDALDWIDKPESDFNPDELDNQSDVDSLTQGRNFARQKRLERMRIEHTTALTSNSYVDETCQVCGKAHDPEWILLCDRCDRGHHAMCLCPPLFVIPEGDWFCPRCQHATLLQALTECADQIDAEQKKQTIWKRMQERLNFVNISMTNILADGDEGEENGRRRRGRPSTQIVYQDSDSSPADQDDDGNATGRDSDKSDSPFLANGSETGSEFGDRRTISRRRSTLNPRVSAKHRVHRAAPRRGPTRWLSESEDESTSASSDVSFESPAPRAARQRPVQYDLGEAFRQLDEALEDDEKYQEEKRRRRSKKSNHKNEVDNPDEHNCSGSPSSGSPTGRSRGKDLSNIMGPDWEEQLDLDRPGRSRKRRVGILSSSSADSDDGKLPIPSSRRKRRGSSDDADDADFQPSGTSEEFSDQSDDEDRDGVDSTSESDTSWLCASRRRKRGTGIKSLQSSRKRPKYSTRRRARPVPRFEQSDNEVSLSDTESSHKDCSRLRPRR